MIRIRTGEGSEFEAETALDAVRELNSRALIGEADAWRYMLRVAERMRQVAGCRIRTHDPSTFLHDMSAAGWLEVSGMSNADFDDSDTASSRSSGSEGECDAS